MLRNYLFTKLVYMFYRVHSLFVLNYNQQITLSCIYIDGKGLLVVNG